MTPAARVQAAVGILDQILKGDAAEKALTRWSRASRFAGSKDRAAIRDHVFDALRNLRSFAALGGGMTGRGIMLGALRHQGVVDETIFSGVGHAPQPLSDAERAAGGAPASGAEAFDLPDWLWPLFQSSLGDQAEPAAVALKSRAPVHLRVNLAKGSREEAIRSLSSEDITAQPHPAAASALEVLDGSRRIRQCKAYLEGAVELQDAASQSVVEGLPLRDGQRVLDYCAGGGGKALAMAARAKLDLYVHDAEPRRMKDLPARAARAGVSLTYLSPDEVSRSGPFDLVLCDVPCSGSGAWRRSPEGKWALTRERLDALRAVQSDILKRAAGLVSETGVLAYATCSVLEVENALQIERFLALSSRWTLSWQNSWSLEQNADGFFAAHLTRDKMTH